MRLPIELLVALLLAKVFENPAFRVYQEPWATAVAAAGLVAASWLLPRLTWSVLRRRLNGDYGRSLSVYEAHARCLTAARCFSVACYAFFLVATGWSALVIADDGLDAEATVIGDDLLQIIPYLAACAALWIGDHPATRELVRAEWGLGEYLRHQARGLLFLLTPWLAMTAVLDSQRYWPWGLAELAENSLTVQIGITALILAAALFLFPVYLVRLWPSGRLPDGELRTRLEALLKRAGVRCRELVVWRTGRGRLPNAAVMGVVARLRYVAFTDALLAELAPEEVEAVLAHEAGHARHHHMSFYAAFAAAFMVIVMAAIGLLPESFTGREASTEAQLAVAAILVTIVVLYWRYAFGFLSRCFERQADAAACEMIGSPGPLAAALEKLARTAGSPRGARSWRHHSIAERVEFLGRAAADPGVIPGHHRHVRRVKIAAALLLLSALGMAVAVGAARSAPPAGAAGESDAKSAQPVARPRPAG